MSIKLFKAELLPCRFDDNTVVDAARISFAKRAEMFSDEDNIKLARYLKREVHWSPFGHQREAYRLNITKAEWLHFLENAILAGFTWLNSEHSYVSLNGSLWAWMENAKWLPAAIAQSVICDLHERYPILAPILWPGFKGPKMPGATHIDTHREFATVGNAKIHYAQFRLASTIFAARQLVKHQVHLCWNEESRRYIQDPVEYYEADIRAKADKVKQGSSNELIPRNDTWKSIIRSHHTRCDRLYNALLDNGAAPEVARGVLPLNSITNWVWTGSLPAWARVVNQRIGSHAQLESYVLAEQIDKQMDAAYPGVWTTLRAEQ